MGKITVNKTVFWEAGGKKMSGKVKQILSDHALVKANDCEYLVQKASLSTLPITHIASLLITAADELPLDKTPGAPVHLRLTYDPATKKWNLKWVDAVGMSGCDPRKHKTIARIDAIFKDGSLDVETQINPELLGRKPGETVKQVVTETPQQQETEAPQQEQLPPMQLPPEQTTELQ